MGTFSEKNVNTREVLTKHLSLDIKTKCIYN